MPHNKLPLVKSCSLYWIKGVTADQSARWYQSTWCLTEINGHWEMDGKGCLVRVLWSVEILVIYRTTVSAVGTNSGLSQRTQRSSNGTQSIQAFH